VGAKGDDLFYGSFVTDLYSLSSTRYYTWNVGTDDGMYTISCRDREDSHIGVAKDQADTLSRSEIRW
jgi:hypothetical protein